MTNKDDKDINSCNEYFDGLLSESEQTAFLQELQADSDMKDDFDKLNRIHNILRQHVPVEPPDGLEERIIANIEIKKPRTAPKYSSYFSIRIAAGLLIIALVGFTAYMAPWQKPSSNSADIVRNDAQLLLEPKALEKPDNMTQNREDVLLEDKITDTWIETHAMEQELAFLDQDTSWLQSAF